VLVFNSRLSKFLLFIETEASQSVPPDGLETETSNFVFYQFALTLLCQACLWTVKASLLATFLGLTRNVKSLRKAFQCFALAITTGFVVTTLRYPVYSMPCLSVSHQSQSTDQEPPTKLSDGVTLSGRIAYLRLRVQSVALYRMGYRGRSFERFLTLVFMGIGARKSCAMFL